jgi:hypothetical protein
MRPDVTVDVIVMIIPESVVNILGMLRPPMVCHVHCESIAEGVTRFSLVAGVSVPGAVERRPAPCVIPVSVHSWVVSVVARVQFNSVSVCVRAVFQVHASTCSDCVLEAVVLDLAWENPDDGVFVP